MKKNRLIFASIFSLFPAIWSHLFLMSHYGEMFFFIGPLFIYIISFPVFLGVYWRIDKIKNKFSDRLEKHKKTVRWSIISGMAMAIGLFSIRSLWVISQYQHKDFVNLEGLFNPYVHPSLLSYCIQTALLKGLFVLTFGTWLLLKLQEKKR